MLGDSEQPLVMFLGREGGIKTWISAVGGLISYHVPTVPGRKCEMAGVLALVPALERLWGLFPPHPNVSSEPWCCSTFLPCVPQCPPGLGQDVSVFVAWWPWVRLLKGREG